MSYKSIYYYFPICVFILVWFSALWLYFTNPYGFIQISLNTSMILISGILSILVGFYFVHLFYLPSELIIHRNEFEFKIVTIDAKKTAMVVLFLSFLVIIGIVISLSELSKEIGGLSNYLINPFKVRGKIIKISATNIKDYRFVYSLGSYIQGIIDPTIILSGVLFTQKSKWRYVGVVPLVLGLMISMINLGRYAALQLTAFWILSYIYFAFFQYQSEAYRILKNSLKYILIIVIILSVFFFIVMRVRMFYLKDIGDYFIKSIYSYFAGTPACLDVFISTDPELTYGASILKSFYKWMARLGFWDADSVIPFTSSFTQIGGGIALNTYTYVRTLYQDFGVLGVLIGSFIWGGLLRVFLELLYKKFSFTLFIIVITLIFSLVMTFYAFYFDNLTLFILLFSYMAIIDRLLKYFGCYKS